jgi:hypothetical protein
MTVGPMQEADARPLPAADMAGYRGLLETLEVFE